MLRSPQIKELRKSGKLQEALAMAAEDLTNLPEDRFAKSNIGWVYYEYLKKYAQEENVIKFSEILHHLTELSLPETDKMLPDNVAWQTGKIIFKEVKKQYIEYTVLYKIIEDCMTMHFTRPSAGYSFLLKAFHKVLKPNSHKYIEFINWWNLDNLQEADKNKDVLPNGKEVMSAAEQVLTAYFKAKVPVGNEPIEKEKVLESVAELDKAIEEYPKYLYLIYFKVKMLLAINEKERLLESFLPFAQKKSGEFWVWDNLAEILEDEEDKVTCLCKAVLSGERTENMTSNVHLKLAKYFLSKNMFSEAKWEVLKIVDIKNAESRRIPGDVILLQNQSWFTETESAENNFKFYQNHAENSVELLFPDKRTEHIFITNVNESNGMINFTKENDQLGFFNKDRNRLRFPIRAGDIIKVKFDIFSENAPSKIIVAKRDSKETLLQRNFKIVLGDIRITDKGFGFIDDVFVAPHIILKHNYTSGQQIDGKAIRTFNKKKEQFGWTLL